MLDVNWAATHTLNTSGMLPIGSRMIYNFSIYLRYIYTALHMTLDYRGSKFVN